MEKTAKYLVLIASCTLLFNLYLSCNASDYDGAQGSLSFIQLLQSTFAAHSPPANRPELHPEHLFALPVSTLEQCVLSPAAASIWTAPIKDIRSVNKGALKWHVNQWVQHHRDFHYSQNRPMVTELLYRAPDYSRYAQSGGLFSYRTSHPRAINVIIPVNYNSNDESGPSTLTMSIKSLGQSARTFNKKHSTTPIHLIYIQFGGDCARSLAVLRDYHEHSLKTPQDQSSQTPIFDFYYFPHIDSGDNSFSKALALNLAAMIAHPAPILTFFRSFDFLIDEFFFLQSFASVAPVVESILNSNGNNRTQAQETGNREYTWNIPPVQSLQEIPLTEALLHCSSKQRGTSCDFEKMQPSKLQPKQSMDISRVMPSLSASVREERDSDRSQCNLGILRTLSSTGIVSISHQLFYHIGGFDPEFFFGAGLDDLSFEFVLCKLIFVQSAETAWSSSSSLTLYKLQVDAMSSPSSSPLPSPSLLSSGFLASYFGKLETQLFTRWNQMPFAERNFWLGLKQVHLSIQSIVFSENFSDIYMAVGRKPTKNQGEKNPATINQKDETINRFGITFGLSQINYLTGTENFRPYGYLSTPNTHWEFSFIDLATNSPADPVIDTVQGTLRQLSRDRWASLRTVHDSGILHFTHLTEQSKQEVLQGLEDDLSFEEKKQLEMKKKMGQIPWTQEELCRENVKYLAVGAASYQVKQLGGWCCVNPADGFIAQFEARFVSSFSISVLGPKVEVESAGGTSTTQNQIPVFVRFLFEVDQNLDVVLSAGTGRLTFDSNGKETAVWNTSQDKQVKIPASIKHMIVPSTVLRASDSASFSQTKPCKFLGMGMNFRLEATDAGFDLYINGTHVHLFEYRPFGDFSLPEGPDVELFSSVQLRSETISFTSRNDVPYNFLPPLLDKHSGENWKMDEMKELQVRHNFYRFKLFQFNIFSRY